MSKHNRNLAMSFVLVLTLGLAPYAPEPHLFGKIRWLAGGGEGMEFMDYFDLLLHGAPWVWLLVTLTQLAIKRLR